MKKILLPVFFLFFTCCGISRYGPDVYRDFYAFALSHYEGKDYEIEVRDISARCSALAIHGGNLEKGTDLLADKVAGREMNFYAFKSLLKKDAWKAHITSSRFNEPRAVFLSKKSDYSISFHGMAENGKKICVGGSAQTFAGKMAEELKSAGFNVQYPCLRLPGRNPMNVANLAGNGGVQLEISVKLLKELDKNPNKLLKFTEAARKAAGVYCY